MSKVTDCWLNYWCSVPGRSVCRAPSTDLLFDRSIPLSTHLCAVLRHNGSVLKHAQKQLIAQSQGARYAAHSLLQSDSSTNFVTGLTYESLKIKYIILLELIRCKYYTDW